MRLPEAEEREKDTGEIFKTVIKISQRSTNGVEQVDIHMQEKRI